MASKAIVVAAAAALGCISASVGAQTGSLFTDVDLVPRPHMLDAAPPPDRPLMAGLTQLGLGKALKDHGISIQGHAQGSYTYNLAQPDDDFPANAGRVFDVYDNQLILNQLSLQANRDVVRNRFDVGGKVELIYGRDARFIHANGLLDYHNDDSNPPPNQWDLTQAYLKLGVPVGHGIEIWAGKMVTHMGYEVIDPTANALFSRSYLFGYAIPFTHTGVMAYYTLNDHWSVMLGFSRGWDQANEDNNDSLDLMGQVKYTRDKWTWYFNFVSGPERADDNGHWRTVLDVIASYAASDQLSLALNIDWGYDSAAAADGDAAQWYGVAGYAGYALNQSVTLNGRAEWFRDADATRLGIEANFYELTLGLSIKPLPDHPLGSNLRIRPEVRYDYCSEDFFDAGSRQDQLTVSVDVVVTL